MTRDTCVCVPAKNEARHIGRLIDSLARQTVATPVKVALCVNNSDDGTADLARQAAEAASGRICLSIIERHFDGPQAHVGLARRAAMDLGMEVLADDRAVLIATDADSHPPEDWIASILREMEDDDSIIGGRILLDDSEDIDGGVLAIRAHFDRYWNAVRAIEDAIDPIPWDMPPRHGDHTGASLAMSVGLYRRAGGVPLIASGEDRALVTAAIGQGGRLRHPMAVWTRVSARTAGRASGGMAGDMAVWSASAQQAVPIRVPALKHWLTRAEWRRDMRAKDGHEAVGVHEMALRPMPCDMILSELQE